MGIQGIEARGNGHHGHGWDAFSPVAAEALLAVAGKTVKAVHPTDHLLSDLGLDSFGVLVFLMELEDRLAVDLPATNAEPVLENVFRLALANGAWKASR
jgi:acyl carrier protein